MKRYYTVRVIVTLLLACACTTLVINIVQLKAVQYLEENVYSDDNPSQQKIQEDVDSVAEKIQERPQQKVLQNDKVVVESKVSVDNEDKPAVSSSQPKQSTQISKVTQPKAHPKLAGLDCQPYGGPSNEIAAEMVYWRDIPSDSNMVSPFAVLNTVDDPKYLTFEPDTGGWDNIRMGMETAIAMAYAMGRTLVLPPAQEIFKLGTNLTLADFYDFDALQQEFSKTFKIITMEEFLKREGVTGKLTNTETGQVEFPPGNRTDWNDGNQRFNPLYKDYIRHVADNSQSKWNYDDCVAAFPNEPGAEGETRVQNLLHFDGTIMYERAQFYRGNPTAVDAPPQERLRELHAHRNKLCVYGPTFQNHKLHHLYGDHASGARLLVHFYNFLFFEDWRMDLWVKRFVRDHLRYVDEVQCAAGRVVDALHNLAKENGNTKGEFDTFHIRRGDSQYAESRVPASKLVENTIKLVKPNSTIFIASDEEDKSYFNVFRQAGYHIYFLDDFYHLLGQDFRTAYYGMVQQRVASRGRTFFGTYSSTFGGYINRLRGYQSQLEKTPGYHEGIVNSYYSVPTEFKNVMQEYQSVFPPMWAREFPMGWRNIDHDILTDQERAERLSLLNASKKSLPNTENNDSQLKDTEIGKVEIISYKDPTTTTPANNQLQDEQHQIAGLNCERYGGPSEDIAEEMVYWRDIPSDAKVKSPFAKLNTIDNPKYLTFEPDEGGWNNIRMGMETAIVMALAMGRTLVLPPEQRMYLLTKDLSFHDFFHLDSMKQEHLESFNIITMEEFLKREGLTGGLRNTATGRVELPPGNRTNWDMGESRLSPVFKDYIRKVADNSETKWFYDDCVVAFPNASGVEGEDRMRQLMDEVKSDGSTPKDRYKFYKGNPTPVNATPYARLREIQAHRNNVCVYGQTFQNHKLHHLLGDNMSGARLLVHFYNFLFFEDWHTDLLIKRFVRDHLRYVDEIQCAAARIVHALRKIAIDNGNPNGEFDTFHIRRGDFQYSDTRISCSQIVDNTKDLLQPNSTIFIATDERDKSFFDPFREAGQRIYFLDDFKHLLGRNFKTTYYGMLDQRIASRGRTFIGAYYSTFTGYINRMRGYHSQKERNPLNGYKEGILNSYYYVPLQTKNALRNYKSVFPPMWAREFPIGWRDIDHDIMPKNQTGASSKGMKNANSTISDETTSDPKEAIAFNEIDQPSHGSKLRFGNNTNIATVDVSPSQPKTVGTEAQVNKSIHLSQRQAAVTPAHAKKLPKEAQGIQSSDVSQRQSASVKSNSTRSNPRKKSPQTITISKAAKGLQTQRQGQHKIAGLNCERYGGPSEDIAEEMVYWRDIPSDAKVKSPFAKLNTIDNPKYLTFEPNEGGWNNIRMGMETAIVMALAMGRTLVLPPEQRMYLLTKDLSFHDFFHLDSMKQEHLESFNIITMEEFLKREGLTGGLRNTATGRVELPPGNRTNWDMGESRLSPVFKDYIRKVADNSETKWFYDDCVVAFPNASGVEGGDRMRQLMDEVKSDGSTPKDRYKFYKGNPTPVNATPYARLREIQAHRNNVCVYGQTFQNHKLHHLLGDNMSGARLLVHFYNFLFFEDWHTDLLIKRFVRDHLRYVDEIQCAAARIVHALRKIAIDNGNPNGEFDTFHIRRGDFQYSDTRISCSQIVDNTKDLLQPNSTIFIATDERDKSFFDPFREAGQRIYFLDDFKHLLGRNFKTTYYGMLDQRIASRGRTFIGTYSSTFTGYINRMRGYHSQKERNPLNGYKEGILNSYYYVPKRFKTALREYKSVFPPMWAREFPIGWRDIDHDVDNETNMLVA